MITIKNLTKTYKTKHTEMTVLRGIDLEIADGEFLGIMGKSGAGKSTLMYQIGLLDHPTGGNIRIDGVDTETLSNDERTDMRLSTLGYVFQDYALIPELTAKENIMIPLLMQGSQKSRAVRLVLICFTKSACRIKKTISRASFPAVNNNACLSHAPWRMIPKFSLLTSLPQTSIPFQVRISSNYLKTSTSKGKRS